MALVSILIKTNMKSDFLQLAISTAFKSQSKFRLGAVLIKKNRVISIGINKMNRTHPLQQKYARTAHTVGLHAEVRACIGVPLPDLQGATVYVARVLKSGQPALAKPCKGCETFLKESGIKQVFYTTKSVVQHLLL